MTIEDQLEHVLTVSRLSFGQAQRKVPAGPARLLAFAAQAAECLAEVDRLGVSRDDPRVVAGSRNSVMVICRMSQGNIDTAAKLSVAEVAQGWRDLQAALPTL